ncbi:F-box/WD repeat-containing protein 4-like [Amphiura filiformis]|uniref:F-box/WD repeat-containing protein 4-like n=1 Tax=Amphiura filiformis TaxID=82378 RepID=UPI003B225895
MLEVENKLALLDLPYVVLYEIFSYLSIADLGRLAQVCRSLRVISGHDTVWRKTSECFINVHVDKHIATSTREKENHERCFAISIKEQCRISYNWTHGHCQDITLKKFGVHLIPWIQLDDDLLYIAQGCVIKGHQVLLKKRGYMRQPKVNLTGHHRDVCRFAVHGDQVVAGGRDGVVLVWNKETGELLRNLSGCNDEAACVDMTDDVIIAGTRDGYVKMWNKTSDECRQSLAVQDRVWSIHISPCQSYFASGTSCITNRQPLKLWDIQSGKMTGMLGQNYRKGAGILDIQWETPSTLLACGYDSFIRLWDTRTSYQTPALTFEEPDNYTFYCMQSDNKYLIASGSSNCGMARLWDKRRVNVMQNIYVGRNSWSPVYSLQFNTIHLYAALSNGLHVLNFI